MRTIWSHKGSKLPCPWCHIDCDIEMLGRGGKILHCMACGKHWPNTCRSTYAIDAIKREKLALNR